jgi:type IV secretory pathway VirD2 relaxase
MTGGDDFEPKPGRIGDAGKVRSRSFRSAVAREVARAGPAPAKPAFTGKRIGRGAAASAHAVRSPRGMSRSRIRRVVVKVHIARAGRGIGSHAFRQHLHYLQRDGVERDGRGGELYGPDGDGVDAKAFVARSAGDRHQFRFIVSAEDADAIDDLKAVTRKLMAEMERDLGTRLDWAAVDHHNTGHSHTHIVVRGRDEWGSDLVIARDYLMHGLRGRAGQVLTDQLGLRSDLEILQAQQREVRLDRITDIDRDLRRLARDSVIGIDGAATPADRFDRSLRLQRLAHLETLGLAARAGPGRWKLSEGWDDILKVMGRRGDIVRALAAEFEPGIPAPEIRFAETRGAGQPPLTGRVLSQRPEDELRDTRFLLVEDIGGQVWHVPMAGFEIGTLPGRGAIVEIETRPAAALKADHVIAGIAARSGGLYSDALHQAADPSASEAYRLAHKRRLEALRRAGLVVRGDDGVWETGEGFLGKAAAFEGHKGGGVSLRVRSWMALEAQVSARAVTWLDDLEEDGPSAPWRAAKIARLAFLRGEGLLGPEETRLSAPTRAMLTAQELRAASDGEARRSGRQAARVEIEGAFKGRFERLIDLAQGRFAVIGNAHAFALVPWRAALERQRGQELIVSMRGRTLGWSVGDGKGLGR